MSLHDSLPPGCEPACHGCRHRLLDTRDSLAQKHDYLRRVLAPWADRIAPVLGPPPGERLGYRERATLTARWDGAGWRFGLVRRDELIAIHDCPVHAPRVNALVRHLVRALPVADTFPLAFLHVAGAQATLIVKASAVDVAELAPALDGLPDGIEGLWLHLHASAGRRLFARSGWRLLAGAAESRDALGLMHGPTAFLQASACLHRAAVAAAQEHLRADARTAVLDLYCGHGGTLHAWRGSSSQALGVELSGEGVRYAMLNAPGALVLRGTCIHRLPQVRAWWRAQAGERVAYVNPPRSGLEPEVAATLARELQPVRLAYLSCSAGTLARDLQVFANAGYAVRRIQPYDFFPLTHHVEALALLGREF